MISSFKDAKTEKAYDGDYHKAIPADIRRRAKVKLAMIDAAEDLDDLKAPPSNNLEKLKGDRKGQHSIRINDRWRICFTWKDGSAHDVELTDYH